VISDEFVKQDITLVVIGIEPSIVVCDDFYCALANKTGGDYLPLINASRVLSSVIQRAILEEDTLSQLFRHLDIHADIEYNSLYHYSYVEKRARFMIEYCHTMTDIRKWLYTYRHQSTKHYIVDNNSEPLPLFSESHSPLFFESHSPLFSKPHSPLLNMLSFDYWHGNASVITSTPLTDDEGYRTRLPTTASAGSSFMEINGSPVLSHHIDWDSNSEIDDESV